MPHFIMEYSANLDNDLDIPLLFKKLNDTAMATGIFPLSGVRTRAVRCEHYRIADGDPDNSFIYFTAKVGTGRDIELLRSVCDKIFATITEVLQPVYDRRHLTIGFEMSELHPVLTYKKNNIEKKLKTSKTA